MANRYISSGARRAVVVRHLIDIFKAVADACDGGELVRGQSDIADAYAEAMRDAEFAKFYGALVDARHMEVYGRR